MATRLGCRDVRYSYTCSTHQHHHWKTFLFLKTYSFFCCLCVSFFFNSSSVHFQIEAFSTIALIQPVITTCNDICLLQWSRSALPIVIYRVIIALITVPVCILLLVSGGSPTGMTSILYFTVWSYIVLTCYFVLSAIIRYDI